MLDYFCGHTLYYTVSVTCTNFVLHSPLFSQADNNGDNCWCTAVGYGTPHTAPQQEMSLFWVGTSSESAKSSSVDCV